MSTAAPTAIVVRGRAPSSTSSAAASSAQTSIEMSVTVDSFQTLA